MFERHTERDWKVMDCTVGELISETHIKRMQKHKRASEEVFTRIARDFCLVKELGSEITIS